MTEVKSIREDILEMIGQFANDPPDGDFQRGYLAALEMIVRDLLTVEEEAA